MELILPISYKFNKNLEAFPRPIPAPGREGGEVGSSEGMIRRPSVGTDWPLRRYLFLLGKLQLPHFPKTTFLYDHLYFARTNNFFSAFFPQRFGTKLLRLWHSSVFFSFFPRYLSPPSPSLLLPPSRLNKRGRKFLSVLPRFP